MPWILHLHQVYYGTTREEDGQLQRTGFGVLEKGTKCTGSPNLLEDTTCEGRWFNNAFCEGLMITGKPKNFVVSYGQFKNGQLVGEGVRQCYLEGKLLRYEAQFVEGKLIGFGHYVDSVNTKCIAKWAGQGYEGPVIQTHPHGSTGNIWPGFAKLLSE